MSEANVEIVRRSLEAFAGDQQLSPEVAKDLVWDMGAFRGWPAELLDTGGEHVLALMTQTARPHGSDADVQRAEALEAADLAG